MIVAKPSQGTNQLYAGLNRRQMKVKETVRMCRGVADSNTSFFDGLVGASSESDWGGRETDSSNHV